MVQHQKRGCVACDKNEHKKGGEILLSVKMQRTREQTGAMYLAGGEVVLADRLAMATAVAVRMESWLNSATSPKPFPFLNVIRCFPKYVLSSAAHNNAPPLVL